MRFLIKYWYILGFATTLVVGYFFFDSSWNSNQGLLNDLIESVSGKVKTVSLCKVHSNEISQNCTYVNEDSIINFIKNIHLAEKSFRPGHSITINRYLIKITSVVDVESREKTNCFLVDEIKGEDDLYLSKIDVGGNCSNNSFKYAEGSVKTPNFLNSIGMNLSP